MLDTYKKNYINKKFQSILVDDQGVIIDSDLTLFKVTKGQLISDLHPFFFSFFSIFQSNQESIAYSCVHLTIEKENFICDIDIEQIPNKNKAVIVFHDLSDHYKAYQALAQTRNESIISTELVTLKNLALEERERFKNDFIVNFSHELRTPLTNIVSFTNLLSKTNITTEQKQYIDFIRESNNNLKLMLEDILNINRIASGKFILQKKIFNLYDLFKVLEYTYLLKTKNKGLDFELVIDKDLPEFVEGDRLRLNQVLVNLLENAIKYTLEGGVRLTASLNQKRAFKANIHFEVSDTGIGIPEDKKEVIFESFKQLNTTEKNQGTGLGLTIVKKLLEQMQSSIKVKNNEKQGTTFYFDLSLKYPIKSLEDSLKNTKETTAKGPTILPGNEKFRLLLVEDDQNIQMILFKMLVSTHRFYIDLINDGEKVIEEVVENNFDIILMDINLPNIEGHIIAKMIRELPFKHIKGIPIIGITANAFPENIKAYKKAGMNAVISKPFEEETLLNTVFKYLK